MAVFIRAKRVSDPLDDKVKACLRGDGAHRITDYASESSGSRHEAASSLSALVHAFLLENAAGSPSAAVPGDHASDQGSTSDDDAGDRAAAAVETVRDLLHPPAERDPFRARLVSDVLAAVEAFAGVRNNGSAFRQAVTAKLMAAGYNAGICKARWEASRRVTAGTYEYIDVVKAVGRTGEMRYIVDLDFAAEFEVARATEEYGLVLAALPRVAVARPEEVRQVVRVVADEARRSLRSRGLHVPPWRKSRYVLAKWLGPYRRSVNALPASA